MTDAVIAAKKSPETLDYLLRRRSCPIKSLGDPGPNDDEIRTILTAAARVPDHGKLFPWYFVVFKGEERKAAGALLKKAYLEEEPNAAPAKLDLEANRFMRAPVIIAVISRVREGKHPVWEQVLSAGAVCHNLSLAAHASGFGAVWLTEWHSYNETFRSELGLDEKDHIAGFIYIGTPAESPEERERPDLTQIVTNWSPGKALNKGLEYGRIGMGYPRTGFSFPVEANEES